MDPDGIWCLDAEAYARHELHEADRDWQESNCYIDVWIEVLHALGLEVHGMLGFTLRADFEDDQWTFYKPPHGELDLLYGLEVQELTVWRSLIAHCAEQAAAKKLVLVEMDAFHLPDAVSDYHRAHTKTTIAVARIDPVVRRLGYFHNTGYYELEGPDFEGVFRTGERPEDELAPYAEIVKLVRMERRVAPELVALSTDLARGHLHNGPRQNPFAKYAERFSRDVEWLMDEKMETYHLYVFAGIRQCGSSFELAARYLGWLVGHGRADLASAAADLAAISSRCKVLVLRLARAVKQRKATGLETAIRQMGEAWERAMTELHHRFR